VVSGEDKEAGHRGVGGGRGLPYGPGGLDILSGEREGGGQEASVKKKKKKRYKRYARARVETIDT
jgi:hypothetical protein